MSVSKYQIIQEVRELVPLAARQLQMMLEDPAVREVLLRPDGNTGGQRPDGSVGGNVSD